MKKIGAYLLVFLILAEAANAAQIWDGAVNNNLSFRMRLNVRNNKISGSYFYKKYRVKILIWGRIEKDGRIIMKEWEKYGRNKTGGLFTGKRISAAKIEGVWSKPDGSRSMPFVMELKKENPMDERGIDPVDYEDAEQAAKLIRPGVEVRTLDLFRDQWAFRKYRVSDRKIETLSEGHTIRINGRELLDLGSTYVKDKRGDWRRIAELLKFDIDLIMPVILPDNLPEERKVKEFSAEKCDIPEYPDAVLIPKDKNKTDARASCLMLTEGHFFGYDEMEEVESRPVGEVCPNLILIEQLRDGRIRKASLPISGESGMLETHSCCNFDQVGVRKDNKQVLHILLQARGGRDCFGGTAQFAIDERFVFDGSRLKLEDQVIVGFH